MYSLQYVLITATGTLGEQPMMNWNKESKGSRQISFVTSEEKVALAAEGSVFVGNDLLSE